MQFFTSAREKRLWLYTALVIAAIYSTLSIARPLAAMLRERDLIDAGFSFGMILVLIAIIIHGIKSKAGKLEIAIWIGIVAVYIIVAMRMAIPEERSHLVEYSIVAICLHEALKERAGNGVRINSPAALALALTLIMGAIDECIQALLPNRIFDPIDIAFNGFAGLFAITASVVLAWARRRLS